MKKIDPNNFYTPKEVAKITGFSLYQVRQMFNNGILRTVKPTANARPRVSGAVLIAFRDGVKCQA